MGKYEAFPERDYGWDKEQAFRTWVVIQRDGNGRVPMKVKPYVATFIGPAAEKDAKCHAAKLNERERGPASPGMSPEDGAKLVEEGQKFVAGMAAPVGFAGVPKIDPELEAAMNTDPRSGERYPDVDTEDGKRAL